MFILNFYTVMYEQHFISKIPERKPRSKCSTADILTLSTSPQKQTQQAFQTCHVFSISTRVNFNDTDIIFFNPFRGV